MKHDTDSVEETAASWLDNGSRVALATVIQTWNSSPRPAGSQMAIDARGHFEGSVSGGCVETAVIEASLECLASGAPRALEFGVSNERAWEVGLACGGRVAVFVAPAELPALRATASLRAARASFVSELDLGSGRARVFSEAELPAALASVWTELARAPEDQRARLLEREGARVFVRLERPAPRLIVIGAVHIAQTLAQLAELAGFELIVVDPRAAFASPERFPNVRLVCEWPERALAELKLDASSALIALSHDPKLDEPALTAALRSEAFYIGALGSRKTQAARQDRLREAGFGTAELARVSGPIGLPIGAKTTAEIAISILAEVIARRRGSA